MKPTTQQLKTKLVRRILEESFGAFFKAVWSTMDPDNAMIPSWHYDYMCEWITYAESGQMKKDDPRKVGVYFCVPPGTSKSLMVTIAFPCWLHARNAANRVACISYGDDIAVPMSVKRRDVLISDFFRTHWPQYEIKSDANLKTRQDNTSNGYMVAATRKSGITGLRPTHIVLDDLLKVYEAYSEPFRNEANRLYDETLRSRFSNHAKNYFLAISQRLHPMDIVGFLKEKEPERWNFVEISLVCEQDTEYVFPVTKRRYLRKSGDVLLPEMFPREAIAGFEKNPFVYAGQYQQRPSPVGGYIYQPDKWKFYRERPELEVQVMSVDASCKGESDSDLCAIHVYGIDGGNRFLFDRRTERMDFPTLEQAIIDMRKKWPKISYVLIEDKANGPAVISRLRSQMTGLIAVTPEGGKESRAHASAADLFAGNCYLPDPAIYSWVQPLIDHFASYNGEGSVDHDDDEDAFSQAINWSRQLFSGAGTWMDKEYERLKQASSPSNPTEICPVCKKPVSYMSGEWYCAGCGKARGSDRGSTKTITRQGF